MFLQLTSAEVNISAIYSSQPILCVRVQSIDYWMALRRYVKESEPIRVKFNIELLKRNESLVFLGLALLLDLGILISIFVRVLILKSKLDLLAVMAFYDAIIVSGYIIAFMLTIVVRFRCVVVYAVICSCFCGFAFVVVLFCCGSPLLKSICCRQ